VLTPEMTKILESKRERLFAAITPGKSDARLARVGVQARYLPACRFACHQAFAGNGGESLIDRAKPTAARAKIPSLQHGRQFGLVEPMAQPADPHAVGGSL
jgi:hypothetical protein